MAHFKPRAVSTSCVPTTSCTPSTRRRRAQRPCAHRGLAAGGDILSSQGDANGASVLPCGDQTRRPGHLKRASALAELLAGPGPRGARLQYRATLRGRPREPHGGLGRISSCRRWYTSHEHLEESRANTRWVWSGCTRPRHDSASRRRKRRLKEIRWATSYLAYQGRQGCRAARSFGASPAPVSSPSLPRSSSQPRRARSGGDRSPRGFREHFFFKTATWGVTSPRG